MTFTLQSSFNICACALTVYIPKTSRQILQGNINFNGKSWFKEFRRVL